MSEAHGHEGEIDVRERGLPKDGAPQMMDRRLFMQLLVFDVVEGISVTDAERSLAEAVQARGVEAVLYADANAPRGLGLLTWTESPEDFVDRVRPAVNEVPGLDAESASRLVAVARKARALKDHGLDEVTSTRALVYAASMISAVVGSDIL